MLKQINTLKFKCKLHFYQTLCCRNRVATKLFVHSDSQFGDQYEFFEDMNANFGQFFAATNYMNQFNDLVKFRIYDRINSKIQQGLMQSI